jgi:hypothetical protein
MRAVLLVAGGSVAALLIGTMAVDEGEVVTLTTSNGKGAQYDTQLWIVRLEDGLYLRSNSSQTAWLARLPSGPEVILQRGDRQSKLRALPVDDPEVRVAVNRAMALKYGAADRFWSWIYDRDHSVPIQLVPVPSEASPVVRDGVTHPRSSTAQDREHVARSPASNP